MKIKLINTFHNSSANVVIKDGMISRQAGKRALKKLCGIKECLCGGVRGGDFYLREGRGDYYFVECHE